MSDTTASEQAAEAGMSSQAGRRRCWVAASAVTVVAATGVVAAAVFSAFGGQAPAPAPGADKTSTAVVKRHSLSSQTQVSATLGYAGSYSVTAKAGGTLTWLPARGRMIGQGQVLFRVDNGTPVFLLCGKVPAWRALSEGLTGADVAQLNRDLVKLGYATRAAFGPRPAWDYFGAETAYALESEQRHLGLTVTGTLPLGQAVFLPSALRVSTVTGSLGGPAAGPVFTATSTSPVVTIKLDAAQQTEVNAGDTVSISMPDGKTTPGRVSSVGKVASGSGSSATIDVQVALRHPNAAGGVDQAPVTVAITTGSVNNVLVVPVSALLARAGGRYAVEVTSGRRRHLVAVTPGLFDDAAGLVQVSGPGLAAGQRVVLPAP